MEFYIVILICITFLYIGKCKLVYNNKQRKKISEEKLLLLKELQTCCNNVIEILNEHVEREDKYKTNILG